MFDHAKHLQAFVEFPSITAVYCQARALREDLETIVDDTFPIEACCIRDIFLCIVDCISERLLNVIDTEQPYTDTKDPLYFNSRKCMKVLRGVYVYARYLKGSSSCPTGIQSAVTCMVSALVKESKNSRPLCLVRPRPKYMASYDDPLDVLLRALADPLPDDIATHDLIDDFQVIWQKWKSTRPKDDGSFPIFFPKHVAIISFPGLDGHDALLYPLLAHEVAHFLIRSSVTNGHQMSMLSSECSGHISRTDRIGKTIAERLNIELKGCLMELMADVVATRLLGFGFFCANAEFLKTLVDWNPTKLITDRLYPENHLRLAFCLDQLIGKPSKGWFSNFLKEHEAHRPYEVGILQLLLNFWESKLASMHRVDHLDEIFAGTPRDEGDYTKTIHAVLNKCYSTFCSTAESIIPDRSRPVFSRSFFERIDLLKARKPPLLTDDSADVFHEIMGASWAYQIIFGEPKDWEIPMRGSMVFEEYSATCKLVLEAVNNAGRARN